MKSIRIAGLCLVAMFVMSMVAAGTASAAPRWETCREGTASTTKYSEEECVKAESGGKWELAEVKGTEPARGFGTVVLRDTKVPIVGTVEASCTGEAIGSVGPGAFSRVEKIEEIKCSPGKNCEEITENAKPVNLPWQGELAEEGTTEKERNKISASGAGAGWAVGCKVLGISKSDECTVSNSESPYNLPFIKLTPYHGTTTSVWLVLLDFSPNAPKAKCSVGGTKAGEVLGSIGILSFGHFWALLIRFH
jgi:hypothetical protein